MESFRKVIKTTSKSQIIEMNIPFLGRMGKENIKESQIITLISGDGYLYSNNELTILKNNDPVYLNKNTITDILNTNDDKPLKVIIEYLPPKYHPRLEQTIEEK